MDVIPAKPVPAEAGSGYPVFKTTFYDFIKVVECCQLVTFYPIYEPQMDTWYPLLKYASGISFVNELLGNIK